MVSFLRLTAALAAVLIGTASMSAAQTSTDAPPVRCVEAIAGAAADAAQAIHRAALEGVSKIERLAHDGAGPDALRAAAAMAHRAIDGAAHQGVENIDTLSRRCFLAGRELASTVDGAGPLAVARHRALFVVRVAATDGHHAIARALHLALPTEPGAPDRPHDMANSGIIRPGGAGSAGELVIEGAFRQAPGATLQIDLTGLSPGAEHDIVNVMNTAELSGALCVELAPGFSPEAGQVFDILTASQVVGAFSSMQVAPIGEGRTLRPIYTDSGVALIVTIAPDLNADMTVDAQDLAMLLSYWGTGGVDADVNADGVVNAGDLALLLSYWGPAR